MGIGQNTLWAVVHVDTAQNPPTVKALLCERDKRRALMFTSERAAEHWIDAQPRDSYPGGFLTPLEIRG